MHASGSIENDFIQRITDIVEENISNEQFGVSELAAELGMSRSNLLRKVKRHTNLSASRFISKVRLEKSMELLKDQSYNVSEVAFKVGFSSTSYFIRCFKDQYGFPPGELGKKTDVKKESSRGLKKSKVRLLILASPILVLIGGLLFIILSQQPDDKARNEKSIAVLPFVNDSDDTANTYIINGLMEAILNKLQKIEDLKVLSRTSVEKYRNMEKTIPEIAEELDAVYFVEGSGQKLGDEVLLSIQLIEGLHDRHLWADQYRRRADDIFNLQNEIALDIARNVEAVITPDEQARLEKVPTENAEAYDHYLRGLDLLLDKTGESVVGSISFFEKAIALDSSFSTAYADIAIAYYLLDIYQVEKKFNALINHYADRALLYDPQLPQALMAKAMFYLNAGETPLALPYLEKAHEYNPNSAIVLNMLADYYANALPDTRKYLFYALKGVRLDIASYDSVTVSNIYLHISNAFIQSGFVDEAESYINKSIRYNPANIYSAYVKLYIQYAHDKNLENLSRGLLNVFARDTSRLDVLQEVGKSFYYQRDYNTAFMYFRAFNKARRSANLSIYPFENAKIGLVYHEMGLEKVADSLLNEYKMYAEEDESIYKDLSFAMYYSFYGMKEEALKRLRQFSSQDNYHYWTVLFLGIDPLVDSIRDEPEFMEIMEEIEQKFWNYHEEIHNSLEKEDLL